MNRLVKIMKDHPICFDNSRPIIGDPWKAEPYGYSCSDGRRTFIAINNPTWLDRRVAFRLDDSIGLQPNGDLEIYRQAPDPARLVIGDRSRWTYGGEVSFYLRPFEVLLFEVTPGSTGPAVAGHWSDAPLAVTAPNPAALELPLKYDIRKNTSVVRVHGEVPPCPVKSTLAVVLRMSKEGKDWKEQIPPVAFCHGGRVGDLHIGSTDFTRNHCGTRFGSWIVYRIDLEPSEASRDVDICLMELQPKDVDIDHVSYLVPADPDNINAKNRLSSRNDKR